MDRRSLPNELLETILIQVDSIQTILLAQRVCRQWANCIQKSPTIQRKLFFRPAPVNSPPERNPLLALKFPYWFPADDAISCTMAFGAGDMQDFLESSETYRRPEASWRRMLVQQPPIMRLGWVECSMSPSNVKELSHWEIPLQAFDGLRMNMLYDMVVHVSESAPEYFYFQVRWSQSKALRNDYVGLNSDPCLLYLSDRVSARLRRAMQSADVVLDMWYTSQGNHLGAKWAKDTWTWELVRGLKVGMGDLDLDLVRCMRELKEVESWTLGDEFDGRWGEIETCSGGMPLPDEDDADL
ncbi:hypothetical protein PENSTE_c002G07042 [Penicillium steckii]|uniref:F-box domain-containing protein n=1 Tax=Penicillium steckii TaxID=303698 RepID=A0A1V6TU70_9EURO|nr:hypothetical protein PENSTE_c002G07042 [Penicillium steckii]